MEPQHLPPVDLIEDWIASQGETTTKFYGSSMAPLFTADCQVRLRGPGNQKVGVGEIVCFKSRSRLIAHRVVKKCVSKGKTHLITKGDNALFFDPPLAPENVVARVIEVAGCSLTTPLWKILGWVVAKVSYAEGRISLPKVQKRMTGLKGKLCGLLFRQLKLGTKRKEFKNTHPVLR